MPCAPADEVNAVVIDVGTYSVKSGYAGEDTPKFVFPSVCFGAEKKLLVLAHLLRPPSSRQKRPAQPALESSQGPRHSCRALLQAVGCINRDGGAAPGADSMDVDGQPKQGRQFFVGTHAMSYRRDHMEVGGEKEGWGWGAKKREVPLGWGLHLLFRQQLFGTVALAAVCPLV